MIYQSILTDEAPYMMMQGKLNPFAEHRHADLEFNYCLHGSFEITIDKKSYRVEKGQMTFISPMVSHGIPEQENNDREVLTVIFGSAFLRKHFGSFRSSLLPSPIIALNPDNNIHRKIHELMEENASLLNSPSRCGELMIQGNLYKLCGYLIEDNAVNPTNFDVSTHESSDMRRVANIEKALELIYYRYTEPITVEMAAEITGYGKSNFCKIFKNVVGDTFHNALNNQRIRSAYGWLRETDTPISAVAQNVGFPETKTFCRVFRAITGVTPGEYRRAKSEE
ncbi:MAG: AraC family transcriptional regulator [Clostridia bacterium]|nr:AraC family transcriptional regulator [Clostridia bacterium]